MNRLLLFFVASVLITNAYCYCSYDETSVAKFEEIYDLPNHPEILFIDLRDPKKLDELLKIPKSIHIPLEVLKETFTSTAGKETFLEKYGRKFPDLTDEIIFMSRSKHLGRDAMLFVCDIGFKKSRNYKWLDWAINMGLRA